MLLLVSLVPSPVFRQLARNGQGRESQENRDIKSQVLYLTAHRHNTLLPSENYAEWIIFILWSGPLREQVWLDMFSDQWMLRNACFYCWVVCKCYYPFMRSIDTCLWSMLICSSWKTTASLPSLWKRHTRPNVFPYRQIQASYFELVCWLVSAHFDHLLDSKLSWLEWIFMLILQHSRFVK